MAWEVLTPSRVGRTLDVAERVTVGWRRQSAKGAPRFNIAPSRTLLALLGWERKQKVEARLDRAAGLLALRIAPEGWAVYFSGGGRSASVYIELPGVESEILPLETTSHRIEDGALIVTLPAWARQPAAAPPQPAPATRPAVPAPAPAAPRPVAAAHARPSPPPAKPSPEQDKADAIKMLEAGLSARTVADDIGLSLATVSNWAAEVRARQQRAA